MDGWQDGSGLKRAWQCSPSVARDKVSRMEAAGPNCKHAVESLYWSFLAKSAAAGPGSLNFKVPVSCSVVVGTEYRHYYCLWRYCRAAPVNAIDRSLFPQPGLSRPSTLQPSSPPPPCACSCSWRRPVQGSREQRAESREQGAWLEREQGTQPSAHERANHACAPIHLDGGAPTVPMLRECCENAPKMLAGQW